MLPSVSVYVEGIQQLVRELNNNHVTGYLYFTETNEFYKIFFRDGIEKTI